MDENNISVKDNILSFAVQSPSDSPLCRRAIRRSASARMSPTAGSRSRSSREKITQLEKQGLWQRETPEIIASVLETAENPKDWVTLWAKTDQKSGTKKEPDADG